MTPKELLIAARRLLADVGWCKEVAVQYSADCKQNLAYCAVGALQAIHYKEHTSKETFSFALKELFKAVYPNQDHVLEIEYTYLITSWNDDYELTKSDMLAAYSKAIEACQDIQEVTI